MALTFHHRQLPNGLDVIAEVNPDSHSFAAGLFVLVAGVLAMRRVSPLEAASMAGLVGLAASPHAWPYDGAVALPAIFWVIAAVAEPWRTRIIVAAFSVAPLWLASNVLHVDLLAFVIVGGAIAWIAGSLKSVRTAQKSVLLRPVPDA